MAGVYLLGVVAVGASMASAGPPPVPAEFLAGIGLFAVAQAIRITLRLDGERIRLSWDEGALVIALCLMDPGWVVPVAATGLILGQLAVGVTPLRALYNSSAIAVATVVAGAAVTAAGGVTGVPPLSLRTILALTVAVVGYVLVSAVFTAAAVMLAHTGPLRGMLFPRIGTMIVMPLAALAVGLLAVGLGVTRFRWLALVPPLLWLLYEVYRDRQRVGEERRSWQSFAEATRALNKLDVAAVVGAAIRGADQLFGADSVEITVCRPVGAARRYLGRSGELAEVTDTTWPEPVDDPTTRTLVVGGERIGELRLRFRGPVTLGPREQLSLSAFANALGPALQNAVAHGQLREMVDRKAYEAEHDSLTGMANRSKLLELGDDKLRAMSDGDPGEVALVLLDLDHFKDVNDTLGHAAGDELLRAAADRLAARTEPDELLARLGGDEFALLITNLPAGRSAIEYASDRARALAAGLAEPVEIAGVALSMEASIGVVAAPAGGCAMTELLRRVDVAMYQAKRIGRPIVRYDPARDAGSTDRLALLAELRDALACDDQLILELQPAVDLATGGPAGVEALVRWRHPRRGLLPPSEFVGAIEQSDLVRPFTRYVLDIALGITAKWATEGLHVPIAVNLSARSLLDRRLPAEVAELLGKHRVPPERLVLEITETVMMTELDIIEDVLAGLRAIGVGLSVDDFGTGYSSLTFLARFAVDEVKVDQAFVARMGDSPEAAAIVRSTVELGRALGLRVIAEGVETAEQRIALTDMGCSAGQGYHFFRPMAIDQATKVLWKLRRAAEAGGARIIPLAGRQAGATDG